MNISVNSSGGASIPPTPEKTTLNNNNNPTDSISPYINQEFYIIKVSIESGAHEIEGKFYHVYFRINSERRVLIHYRGEFVQKYLLK